MGLAQRGAAVIAARHRVGGLALVCRHVGSSAWARAPLARALCPGSPSWDQALNIAAEFGVAPALSGAIDRSHDDIPARIAEELRRYQLLNTTRNLHFRRSLRQAVEALNRAGIVPLLFKGALELTESGSSALSDRWMVDLDLLVPAAQLPEAGRAMESIGYEANPGPPFMHTHELPYARAGEPGPIELHATLGAQPIAAVLAAEEAWSSSSELRLGAGRGRALTPTHRVLHNVLHSAVQDLNHTTGGLPLRQLLTLAGLVRGHADAIDWRWIHRRMRDHGLERELRDHLWLAHRFGGMELPPEQRAQPPGRGRELHEARVLVNFALGWPADVHRNLRFAFGRAYLDFLYGHGDRPGRLAAARARHAVNVARRDGITTLRATVTRRS